MKTPHVIQSKCQMANRPSVSLWLPRLVFPLLTAFWLLRCSRNSQAHSCPGAITLATQLFPGCLLAGVWDFAHLTAQLYCWLRFLISCTRESPMQTGRWRGSDPSMQVPSLPSSKGFRLCSFLWRHFHSANIQWQWEGLRQRRWGNHTCFNGLDPEVTQLTSKFHWW